GAGGRTRTDTGFYTPRILSPVRLPFRHTGKSTFEPLRSRIDRTRLSENYKHAGFDRIALPHAISAAHYTKVFQYRKQPIFKIFRERHLICAQVNQPEVDPTPAASRARRRANYQKSPGILVAPTCRKTCNKAQLFC
ncbi:MAG: hypothetical protein JWM99_2068, partial [Verrucomicrobiales bacterium]|nr:hypothetical protein [Verrucomicrobiales bacterium]